MLFDWRIERNMPDPGEALFLDTGGQRYRPAAVTSLVIRLGHAAGITRFTVTPHVVRHTMELIRRRSGIDPTVRSKLLTHSNLGSLVSYQHVLPDELGQARERQVAGLSAYLNGYIPELYRAAAAPQSNPS